MENTAIVLGASGLVGSSVVEQLSRAGHVDRVLAITRRPICHDAPQVVNEVVRFERLDEHAAAFRGRYLFSCLGTTRRQAGSLEAQRRVDLDYQFAAARLAAEHGVQHYLLVSSCFADAGSSSSYLQMKGELEQRILELPFQRISIFQPSVLAGQRNTSRAAEAVGGAMLGLLSHLPVLRRYRPIRGDQVAAKMVQVSAAPGPRLQRFALDQVFP
jgi:uncharacterized protein YbjT (DUF2867 family)